MFQILIFPLLFFQFQSFEIVLTIKAIFLLLNDQKDAISTDSSINSQFFLSPPTLTWHFDRLYWVAAFQFKWPSFALETTVALFPLS